MARCQERVPRRHQRISRRALTSTHKAVASLGGDGGRELGRRGEGHRGGEDGALDVWHARGGQRGHARAHTARRHALRSWVRRVLMGCIVELVRRKSGRLFGGPLGVPWLVLCTLATEDLNEPRAIRFLVASINTLARSDTFTYARFPDPLLPNATRTCASTVSGTGPGLSSSSSRRGCSLRRVGKCSLRCRIRKGQSAWRRPTSSAGVRTRRLQALPENKGRGRDGYSLCFSKG